MSVSYRTRVETYAGAMSMLFALIPFEVSKALGSSEDQAFVVAWYALLGLVVVALLLRASPLARKTFHLKVYSEDFSVSNYLRAFALYSLTMLALSAFAWFQLSD